jgi:siroheme synthase-like protein
VTLDVEGRRALVLGGDAEAEDKVGRLLDGGALVTVVARAPSAALVALGEAGRVALVRRDFEPGDTAGVQLVLVCARDPELAARAHAAAQQNGATSWACDDPARSDLAMPAVARLGRARLAVSTAGAAPALASRVRAAIERDLGAEFAAFVERLAASRERILAEEPEPARRRERLRALVEEFELRLHASYPPPTE